MLLTLELATRGFVSSFNDEDYNYSNIYNLNSEKDVEYEDDDDEIEDELVDELEDEKENKHDKEELLKDDIISNDICREYK